MTYQVSTSERTQLAAERLTVRFNLGERERADLIAKVAMTHIRDKLVPPPMMKFTSTVEGPKLTYRSWAADNKPVDIGNHALGQMCQVAGIPKTYVNRLLKQKTGWETELFDHNMNELFGEGSYKDRAGNPTKFLHRLVGNELRGFLSRNFNRHLASLPLLRGFSSACDQVGALPIAALASPVRFSLQCFLPHVFEPVPGEFVAFGVTWSNSDFGAGRLRVALSTMRISSGSTAVLDDVMSRVHIGSVIQDSDLEMSNETAAKEIDTQVSAIHDAVTKQLAPDPVNRLLEVIALAHEERIPWRKLRAEMGSLLQKSEMASIKDLLNSNGDSIVDLPPPGRGDNGEPIATRWWAASAVSWVAERVTDADRKSELQQLSGSLIEKAKAA